MTLYTTFNTILNAMENATTYQKWIEDKLTGNRNLYGLDTPIYLLDVLNVMGIQDAITLLDCCVQDVSALRKIIGMDIARAFQGPWQAYTDGADVGKLDNLLTFAERCMDSQETDTTRYDYCGDPIPGSGDVTSAQVDALIAQIQGIYDTWTYESTVQPIYTWVAAGYSPKTNDDIPSWQQSTWTYEEEYHPDWFSSTIYSSAVSFIYTRDIAQSLADDPDEFYKLSIQLQQNMTDQATFFYQRVKIWPRGSGTAIVVHEAQAAKYAALASIAAARMTAKDIGSLSTIVLYCQRAQMHTDSAAYRTRSRALLRTRELQALLMPYPAFPEDDPAYAIEKDIIDQAQVLRAELFRDQAFIEQYDSNYDGDLSASEFLNLEKGVRTAMQAKAKELSDAYLAEQTSGGTDLTVVIDGILRAYIV